MKLHWKILFILWTKYKAYKASYVAKAAFELWMLFIKENKIEFGCYYPLKMLPIEKTKFIASILFLYQSQKSISKESALTNLRLISQFRSNLQKTVRSFASSFKDENLNSSYIENNLEELVIKQEKWNLETDWDEYNSQSANEFSTLKNSLDIKLTIESKYRLSRYILD